MVLNCDVVLTHPKIDRPVPLVEIITCSMTTAATPDFYNISAAEPKSSGSRHVTTDCICRTQSPA